jgi:predicted  nucleic acid-binding Zn-ribbon protein
VKNKEFAKAIKEKIGNKIDTSKLDKEIENYKNKLSEAEANKKRLEDEIDNLPLDVPHKAKKLTDKNNRLDALYDTIEEIENLII